MKKTLLLAICIMAAGSMLARAADAKETWTADCAKCHGADGKGATTMGKKLGIKDYTDPAVQTALKDEDAIKAIKSGVKDKDGKDVMKSFSDSLTDDQAKALVAYIRAFKKP